MRMDENELPKEILWTNRGAQRGRGRPKSRRIVGVEEDARKLGCRNWRAAAQDRGRWRHCLRRPRSTQGYTADRGDDDDGAVVDVYTDVSAEHIASVFRMTG